MFDRFIKTKMNPKIVPKIKLTPAIPNVYCKPLNTKERL